MIASIVAGLMACLLIVLLVPRLWAMHLSTTRPLYLLMYPAKFLWAWAVLSEALSGGVAWYTPLGLVGMVCWALVTRRHWREGELPGFARSGAAPLDAVRPSEPAPRGARVLTAVREAVRPPPAPHRRRATDWAEFDSRPAGVDIDLSRMAAEE